MFTIDLVIFYNMSLSCHCLELSFKVWIEVSKIKSSSSYLCQYFTSIQEFGLDHFGHSYTNDNVMLLYVHSHCLQISSLYKYVMLLKHTNFFAFPLFHPLGMLFFCLFLLLTLLLFFSNYQATSSISCFDYHKMATFHLEGKLELTILLDVSRIQSLVRYCLNV